MNETILAIVFAVLTAMVYSLLYKENIFYRIIETVVVGFMMGYTLYATGNTIQKIWVTPFMGGNWILIIPAIMGMLLYTIFYDRYRFLSRWTTSAIVGTGLGLAVGRIIPIGILGQLKVLYMPLAGADTVSIVNWLIVLISTTTSIAYFTFTKEHTGVFGKITWLGRAFLFLAFGTTFALSTFTKISYVIKLTLELAQPPQSYVVPIAFIVIAFAALRDRRAQANSTTASV